MSDHILGAEVAPLHQRHHRWVHMAIGNDAFHGALLDDQVIGLEAGVTLPNTHHHHFAALVSAVQRLVEHGGNAGHFEGHVHPAAAQGV